MARTKTAPVTKSPEERIPVYTTMNGRPSEALMTRRLKQLRIEAALLNPPDIILIDVRDLAQEPLRFFTDAIASINEPCEKGDWQPIVLIESEG